MIVDATAPCSIELVGGRDGLSVRLAIAIDRRPSCRVETGHPSLALHLKDQLLRLEGDSIAALGEGARKERVVRALEAAGLENGARVETQARVPLDTGLAVGLALSVAVVAAARASLGKESRPEEAGSLAHGVELALGGAAFPSDVAAAASGGAHLFREDGPVPVRQALPLDPARLEECLLLVDAGPCPEGIPPFRFEVGPVDRAIKALLAGRYGEVAPALHASDPSASADARVARIRQAAGEAEAAVWPCRQGRLLAVWAAPGSRAAGPREAVEKALRSAGLRPFPARVDVRGLEVE